MSALTGKGLVTAGGFNPNTVGASAIFDGSADYMSQTPSAGNSDRFICGAWVLRTAFAGNFVILGAGTTSNYFELGFDANDKLYCRSQTGGVADFFYVTNGVYRDVGWYHVVFSYENGEGLLYANGDLPSLATDTDASAGTDAQWNKAVIHTIARYPHTTSGYFNGYVAQPFNLDAKSIQNSDHVIGDFGQTFTAGTNGTIWSPKPDASIAALAAAAGGNSFCLTDGIAAGTDASGNGNSFTPSGSPTASGNTPSKVYAVINPLQNSAATVSAGSLSWSIGAADGFNTSTLGMTSGKWVCEYTETGSNSVQFGVVSSVAAKRVDLSPTTVTGGAYFYADDGNKYVNGSSSAYGATYTASDVIRIELDLDTPQVEFFKNGSSQGTISITETDETWFFAGGSNSGTASYSSVFIEGDFAGTPTAGFKALNSANLTAPTYQGADWFNALAYTGNSPSTQSLSGVGFSPDLVWTKNRTAADAHGWFDRIRTATEYLESNNTNAENTDANSLTSFDADGFSVGTSHFVNGPSENMVAWNWRGDGTTGTTNNDGSITSTVNVAEPGHFSFGTYTGTGANATVGHGLSAAPEMIVVKNRVDARSWPVYHHGVAADPETDYLLLDVTNAAADDATFWNDTAPTSTVFSVGTAGATNDNTDSHIFYAFRSVPGVCKVGSYTGNGSADGPYVHLGFKPRWVMLRSTGGSAPWFIVDAARFTANPTYVASGAGGLSAESTTAEASNQPVCDLLSDGFKLRKDGTTINVNISGTTYIYLAMADVAGNGVLPPVTGR